MHLSVVQLSGIMQDEYELCTWNLHIVQQHYFMSFGGYFHNLTYFFLNYLCILK